MPIPVERLALTKKRLKSVLSDRLYANLRQLESKISESGPPKQLCDPHVITHAVREMLADNELKIGNHPVHNNQFYYLPSLESTAKGRRALEKRRLRVEDLYSLYIKLSQHDSRICGDALETVLRKAINNSGMYLEIGTKKNPVLTFGGNTMHGALDGTYMLRGKQQLLIAVEAKNIREWVYPQSQELWGLIHKANTISSESCLVLPVIVCRKIPYYTRVAFKRLGVLGFDVHNQFFDPSVENLLVDIKGTDGLGFKDIKTELVYRKELLKWLQKTVPEYGPGYAMQFLENKPLLDRFAPTLAFTKVSGGVRNSLWNEIKTELKIFDPMSEFE